MDMRCSELKQFENAIDFSTSLVNESKNNFQDLLNFLDDFGEIYDNEIDKLPYHINIIDELNADENAHSRIFAQLLRYEKNNKYPFLEKFLNEVCSFDITVKKPIVKKVDSCGRIDIPIFDEQYVVVIENKVTDQAPDQNNESGGQLARYIETINHNYNRKLKEIFVVYTPKYTREPSNECWINKVSFSYKDDFEDRFCSLSYRDVIYPWIKDDILPIIDVKDIYLRSAIEQYVDHLEGEKMFNLRNKKMNMELQKFIKEKLGINDDEPSDALKIVSEKLQEMDNAYAQLKSLQVEFKNEIDEKYFSNCYLELKELNLEVVRKIDCYPTYFPKSVGVKLNNNLMVWLGESDYDGFFCQVNNFDKNEEFPQSINQIFKIVFEGEKIEEHKEPYYICAFLDDREKALNCIKEFCKKINNN